MPYNNKKTYISIEEFAVFLETGRLYEGYVVGLGYAYVETDSFNPPNLNGFYNPGNVPPALNRFAPVRKQCVDYSTEAVLASFGDNHTYLLERLVKQEGGIYHINMGNGKNLIVPVENTTISLKTESTGRLAISVKSVSASGDLIEESIAIDDARAFPLIFNGQDDIAFTNAITQLGQNALSLYGIANSVETLSEKLVILGPEYNIINSGGTRVRNPNRIYTTRGAIAKGVGHKITAAGVIIDIALYRTGQQSLRKTFTNIAANGSIWAVGMWVSPYVAVGLGIAWFLISNYERPDIPYRPYEEIHGSNVPADNTRVVTQPVFPPVIQQPVYYEQKQYFFRQGYKR